jgi:hypothetical protein
MAMAQRKCKNNKLGLLLRYKCKNKNNKNLTFGDNTMYELCMPTTAIE